MDTMGKRQSLQLMVLENWISIYKGMKLDPYLATAQKSTN
jgi:hypothetical protein